MKTAARFFQNPTVLRLPCRTCSWWDRQNRHSFRRKP